MPRKSQESLGQARSAANARCARWFFLGVGCGEILCVLSLHFLARPGVQLNWPVVASALVLIACFAAISAWSRHA